MAEEKEEEEEKKKGEESLEDRVAKLKENLDTVTHPDFEWDVIKETAPGAARKYLKAYEGGEKVEDRDYEPEFNKRTKKYIREVGIDAGKQGDEFYGHMMRNWTQNLRREERQALEDAIKKGDELTAASIMQSAYQSEMLGAKLSSAESKVEGQDPDVKLKFYKDLAKDLAGKVPEGKTLDYFKVIGPQNLRQAYVNTTQKRKLAHQYLYSDKKAA